MVEWLLLCLSGLFLEIQPLLRDLRVGGDGLAMGPVISLVHTVSGLAPSNKPTSGRKPHLVFLSRYGSA